jgi:hypothetical protein
MTAFERMVQEEFIKFLGDNKLPKGTIFDGCGNKATVKKDKHGFYKITVTQETTDRGLQDVGD